MKPSTYNIDLAIEKNLTSHTWIDETYTNYQNIYKDELENFLIKEMNLKKYDDEISKIGIKGINSKLKHINLLNNIHIEKLSDKDIEKLKNQKNVIDIVLRTYNEVLKANFINNEYKNKPFKVCYGNQIPKNFVDNDAIILEIPFKIDSSKEYIEYKKAFQTLSKIREQMEEELNNILDFKVRIIINQE